MRCRVYHGGLSFFALYPRAWWHVLGEGFRDFEYYFHDMQTEPVEAGSQVIVVEPSYNDGPHIGPDHPNDNHCGRRSAGERTSCAASTRRPR